MIIHQEKHTKSAWSIELSKFTSTDQDQQIGFVNKYCIGDRVIKLSNRVFFQN